MYFKTQAMSVNERFYLSVPAEWEVFGVVRDVVIVVIRVWLLEMFIVWVLPLLTRSGLFALDIVTGGRPLFTQEFGESVYLSLQLSNLFLTLSIPVSL